MRTAASITLILFGFLWLYWAMAIPMTMRMRALSDAKSFQYRLSTWMDEKVMDRKLNQPDIEELFSDRGALRWGGENPAENFDGMIQRIATSSAPPWWPGAAAILVGVMTLFARSKPPECRRP
jgi:hypothetical protein